MVPALRIDIFFICFSFSLVALIGRLGVTL